MRRIIYWTWDIVHGVRTRSKMKTGWFHQWGSELVETNESAHTYTVGIVEAEDGDILTIIPSDIHFMKGPDYPEPLSISNIKGDSINDKSVIVIGK